MNEIGAVILNGSPTGLCAVRSLGRKGIPTAVVQTRAHHIAEYSHWASESHNLLDFYSEPESLLELLEYNSRRWRGRVLLPASDRTLTLLAKNRDRLLRDYRVPVPPWEITQKLLRKDVTNSIAREVGVDTPRDYGPAIASTANRKDISYPVIVKPVLSHDFTVLFGQKLFVAHDRRELEGAIEKLAVTGLEARVVDLIPGPDSQFYNYTFFLDERGDPVAEFGFRKLRKSPPRYGVGRVVESADVPELREPTLELLRQMGWSGIASAEYKLDPRDGRFRLMEVNGRLYLTVGLAVRAGVDYPFLMWAAGAGMQQSTVAPNGWKGAWIDLRAEFAYSVLLRGLDGLTWRETLAPYRQSKTYAIWSASDTRPFAAAQFHLARRGIGALRKGRARLQRQLEAAVPAR